MQIFYFYRIFNLDLDMKLKTALFIFFVSAINLLSSPIIKYIIPDIGAPGMNIYVEFIGPFDIKGNFGSDGLSTNNSSDMIRIEPINAIDTNKIVIGPCVVSWDGRMISSQIFVNPNLNPNSTDALNTNIKIELRVIVNGVYSNPQTFYIVKPNPIWDFSKLNSDNVIGAGNLGKRSPRGAMIFDSLKFDNKTYQVSKVDCDLSTPGYQGYLPFIILCKGKIIGGTNTILDISGEAPSSGHGGNGGPGGGGGGGRFCDRGVFGSSDGDNGGDGFTGGGSGGVKNVAPGGSLKVYGNGTYEETNPDLKGSSLNGVPNPLRSTNVWEASGGGTGHPFGSCGVGTFDGNSGNPEGGYGGGSGRTQTQRGGSGGYGTDGDGINLSMGKVVGNIMGVPIAGGSGGASGNPQKPDGGCAGSGGGGSGAISISGLKIDDISITAKGGDGYFSDNNPLSESSSHGGSGSGGLVIVGSKLKSTLNNLNIQGGMRNNLFGGDGRARIDAPEISVASITSKSNQNYYSAMTSDSTQFVQRSATIRGSLPIPVHGTNVMDIYIKSQSTDWVLWSSIIKNIASTPDWKITINLDDYSKTDNLFYVAYLLKVEAPALGDYISEPTYVMSQAAANLLIVNPEPLIDGEKFVQNDSINCSDGIRYFRIKMKNKTEALAPLSINVGQNFVLPFNGFTVVSPLGNIVLFPGKDTTIVVKYQYPTGGDKTKASNSLKIFHDATNATNPWEVELRAKTVVDSKLIIIGSPTLNFPNTKLNNTSQQEIQIQNDGESNLYVPNLLGPIPPCFNVLSTTPLVPVLLKPKDILKIMLEFKPQNVGVFQGIFAIDLVGSDTTCAPGLHIDIIGKVPQSSVFVDKLEIDFGILPWCQSKRDSIHISNQSSTNEKFSILPSEPIYGDNPESFLLTNPNSLDMVLYPGIDGSKNYYFEFPNGTSTPGKKLAKYKIKTTDPENPEIEITLKGEISAFKVDNYPSILNLSGYVGFDLDSAIILTNNSKVTEKYSNKNSSDIKNLIVGNGKKTDLLPTEKDTINLKFVPTVKDVSGEIIVRFNSPCLDSVIVRVNIHADSANVALPDTLNYGIFSPCDNMPQTRLKRIDFTNISLSPYIVRSETINDKNFVFSKSVTGLIYPDTIPKIIGNKPGMQIYFDGTNKPDGIYYADYIATLWLNGEIVQKKVVLKAEVKKGVYLLQANPLQMSEVVGLSDLQKSVLTNTGPWDIKITSVSGPSNPLIFKVDITKLTKLLKMGNTLDIDCEFVPPDVLNYNDSLVFTIDNGGCIEKFTLYLNGMGKVSKEITLWIPKLNFEPTSRNVKIPIYAKLSRAQDSLDGFTIDLLVIGFNRSLFYPTSLTNGTILRNTYDTNTRWFAMKIDSIKLNSKDSLLTEIIGDVLLGNNDSTKLSFDSIAYYQMLVVKKIKVNDGLLTINICREGGERLLDFKKSPLSFIANPNPATDFIEFDISMLEIGGHKLELSDINGNSIDLAHWDFRENESNKKQILIDLNKFSNGVYFVRLKGPNRECIQPIYIVK